MKSPNVAYIDKLDHLRFLAAFMVLVFHTNLWYVSKWNLRDTPLLPLFDQGYTGVALFMVISGMILTIATDGKEIDVRSFFLNRVLRIYPLFVVVVTLGYFATPDPRPTSVGIDYLMALLPISNLYRLQYGAYGGALFSVAIELQFYLLFPILLAMSRRSGGRYLGWVIAGVFLMRGLIYGLNGTVHQYAYYSLPGCLDIFSIGMLVGLVYKRLGHRAWGWYWPLLMFLIVNAVLFVAHRHSGFFHFAYDAPSHNEVSRSRIWIVWPTALGLLWAAFLLSYLKSNLRVPLDAVWSYLGQISYSLYVWHTIVCMIVVAHPALFGRPYLSGLFVVFPATVALASLSYYLVEAPFLAMRVKYTR